MQTLLLGSPGRLTSAAALRLRRPASPAQPARALHADDPRAAFAHDVLAGLGAARKSLPCKWLYDHRGSELFEALTQVPEYYPTESEILILTNCAAQIAELAGPGASVVELGSGSSRKTPLLLQALERPAAYTPVDISAQFLHESIAALRAQCPGLPMQPLVADFTQPLVLPPRPAGSGRRVVFFPGSTIGNFTPREASALLAQIAAAAGPRALLVVGADATQDPALLLPAYDDALGVTAAFNRNLLARINRELGADFDLGAFRHEARVEIAPRRVEMHLVSTVEQEVRLLGQRFWFAAGESIHTESSHKYGPTQFQTLAEHAGWEPRQMWIGGLSRFAVHVLERAG